MAISWYDSTWGVTAYLNVPNPLGEVSITAGSVTFTMPTIQAKATGSDLTTPLYIGIGMDYTAGQGWSGWNTGLYLKYGSTVVKHFRLRTGNVAKGSYGNVSYDSSWGDSVSVTLYTSSYFSSSNSTTRSVNLSLVAPQNCVAGIYEVSIQGSNYATNPSEKTLSTIKLTLNTPPTFKIVDGGGVETTQVDFDTAYVYAGLTTASVNISNLSAKYGGTITDATLTIGNQTASRSDNGTLFILLNEGGTFTPTVTVTDSRGLVTTKQLDPITVNVYDKPSVNLSVERTLPKPNDPTPIGKPDDEGESATITATLTFTDAITTNHLVAPTVVVTDAGGNTETSTVTWYSSRNASTGELSGSVSWSSLSSGATVYGLVTISGDFDTQESYSISVTPEDSIDTGTTITQTLATAFYTVDFLGGPQGVGGHGIAFGQPASQVGFFCNMDAHFVDNNSVMRALFDFIYPVGSYYETSDTTFDPNVTWGGTWSLETEGQVHISAGANYAVAGALTDTTDGGEETHTLDTTEIPAHTHGSKSLTGSMRVLAWSTGTATGIITKSDHTVNRNDSTGTNLGAGTFTVNATHEHTSVGGGQAHNNLPPYIIVNRWHRTA